MGHRRIYWVGRNWTADIHTAADVAVERQITMLWAANNEEREAAGILDPRLHGWRRSAKRMAADITRRAVELGLEKA